MMYELFINISGSCAIYITVSSGTSSTIPLFTICSKALYLLFLYLCPVPNFHTIYKTICRYANSLTYLQGNKWTVRGTYKFVGFGSADTKDITQLFNIIESGFFLFFHMDTSFRGGRLSEMKNKYKVENIISNASKNNIK